MRRVSKLLSPLFVCALAVLSAQAQGPRNVRVDFKETTLKNGLRVITVEDHSRAGSGSFHHLQRRFAQRTPGSHRVRASLRAHDVQRLGECRIW